jgi:hypothetical protein
MSMGTGARPEAKGPFPNLTIDSREKCGDFVANSVLGDVPILINEFGNYIALIGGKIYPAVSGSDDGLQGGIYHFTIQNPLG